MEFLFENPLLIIILIAIFSSMFKKNKFEEKKDKPDRGPVRENKPLQGPRNMTFPGQEPVTQQVGPKIQKSEKQFNHKKKRIEDRMSVLKEQELELAQKADRIKEVKSLPSKQDEKEITQKKQTNSIPLDKENMVNGIILSEILGPPRSKKLHRSLSRR